MKKILFATVSMMLSLTAAAQDYRVTDRDAVRFGYERPLKCEIRFGLAGYPMLDVNNFDSFAAGRLSGSRTLTDREYLYSDYYGAQFTTGRISAEFDFLIRHWLNVSLCLSDCHTWRTVYDGVTDECIGTVSGNTVMFMPQVRFTYLSKRYVKLYSSIGAGVYAGKYGETWKFGPAWQFCPIGVMTGRRVFGFTEIGAGTAYVGLNAGVGFRF